MPIESTDDVEALYRAHHAEVLAYCARRIGRTDADDVVSEVFAVAWRRRDEIDPATARPWLYGIARGVLSNRWRSRGRHLRLVGKVSGLAETPHETPDVVVVRRESDQEVLSALRRLRSADQEILRLAAWEDLGPTEIALVLDITVEAAKQRLHRAKRRLAAVLDGKGERS